MRPVKPNLSSETDLFRSRLDQIINMRHELVRLAQTIDWDGLDAFAAERFSPVGRPGVGTRFMMGLLLLKAIYGLSDEAVCDRWVENPYFQYFTGEAFFAHAFPHERSDLSHWRKRLGGKLDGLLAESLRVAEKVGALKKSDLSRVTVDTTVQPKAVTFPTDAKLLATAIAKLGDLAKAEGVRLRQSYVRLAKRSAIMAGRYIHAKQFNRSRRELKFLRTRLGRLIRDIRRRTSGDERLTKVFSEALDKAFKIHGQKRRQQEPKIYSWHAPETECIGKGKAHKPYEFGVKVTITTPNHRSVGGQFVIHALALPGNPYDGHTLAKVIPATEAVTGRRIERVYVDKGYRGHGVKTAPVYISGQKRGVFGVIKRELKRRSAVEPVIGHMKTDGHLGRNFLKGRLGDQVNAVLSAVGYNFRLILKWLKLFVAILQQFRNWPLYAKNRLNPVLNGRLSNF
jgi:IS5 family transposase